MRSTAAPDRESASHGRQEASPAYPAFGRLDSGEDNTGEETNDGG